MFLAGDPEAAEIERHVVGRNGDDAGVLVRGLEGARQAIAPRIPDRDRESRSVIGEAARLDRAGLLDPENAIAGGCNEGDEDQDRHDEDRRGGTTYAGTLHYWIAEAVLDGELLGRTTRDFYLAPRASALGTFDGNEGNLREKSIAGSIGWNAESILDDSTAIGWRMIE